MLQRMVLQSLVSAVAVGLLLFLPAGTLRWGQAWAFIVLFSACSLATGVWLRRVDPGLLAERMASPLSAGQSYVPPWAQALGAVLIAAAFYGWTGVLRANSFAAVTIRLQKERGQTAISTGPYAVVRHPMYAYGLLLMVGTPLLLGSLWGLAGVAAFMPLIAARTLGEEAILDEGLPGYREYAAKVRFRMVPGVW